jgi:hypothetical protein
LFGVGRCCSSEVLADPQDGLLKVQVLMLPTGGCLRD